MRVFVGSSSQAKKSGDLDAVCELLRNTGLEPRPWADPEAFFLNAATWDFLLTELAEVDAAAFVFREDDQIRRPDGELLGMTRGNVVLEFGLFTGALNERARKRFKTATVQDAGRGTELRNLCKRFPLDPHGS